MRLLYGFRRCPARFTRRDEARRLERHEESGSERWNSKKSKKMKWRTVQPEKIQKHGSGGPYNEKKFENDGEAF
jgi:hypothetical protein